MASPGEEDERAPLDSPGSSDSSPATSPPLTSPTSPDPAQLPASSSDNPRYPSSNPRGSTSSSTAGMSSSSTPLGSINAARRPGPPQSTFSNTLLTGDIQARMKAFHLGRQGSPNSRPQQAPGGPPRYGNVSGPAGGGVPASFRPQMRPGPGGALSAPAVPNLKMGSGGPSLAQKRGMQLPGGLPGGPTQGGPAAPPGRKKPGLKLSDISGPGGDAENKGGEQKKETSMFDQYSEFVDKETGSLKFAGKAVIHGSGIEFTSGKSFNISLDEVDTLDELGKGNYGTVYKVRHSRPRIRRPGLGLAGNKATSIGSSASVRSGVSPAGSGGGSGIVMAMKEIRLELDKAKFQAIIMELDILHRCVSPFIIDFYGAFFQEGAVYLCIEYMDGGSIDKLYGDGISENVLRKIALSTVMGLKSLKDEHNIIHRDVKPTNILVNTRGQVKICDFGVSGNLVASIARTNIGCQSYMAPERISGGGVAQAGANPGGGTYSVQSDIWSLGLTIIECAMGQYPYPPETYNNIFSQLSAIVDGEPPDLPKDGFSEVARNFVAGCLNKIPKLRPTYGMLLQHAWLAPLLKPPTINEEDEEGAQSGETAASATAVSTTDKEVADWVINALERKRAGKVGKKAEPALHAAPLDVVPSPS